MKKLSLLFLLFISLHVNCQTVFGYWYGQANVKTTGSTNNYLVEMILQPEKNYVKGILNYYFKDTYRSLKVEGDYDAANRQLSLYNIPMSYHGSPQGMEVDCMMNFRATLRVAQAGSSLQGLFFSQPDYRYTCPDISFNLSLNADISKKDSVMQAMSEYRENFQVWKPQLDDTLIQVATTPKKVVNFVTESEFTKRQNVITQEIEVESDTLQIDVYDNGEIDGDVISLFYNQQLILNSQKLTHKAIRIDLVLDRSKEFNEISLFAENLGLIPPNTALVAIDDGKNHYDIRVSSSLEKNATLRLKRKPVKTQVKQQ
jgi:hypothetical protein